MYANFSNPRDTCCKPFATIFAVIFWMKNKERVMSEIKNLYFTLLRVSSVPSNPCRLDSI